MKHDTQKRTAAARWRKGAVMLVALALLSSMIVTSGPARAQEDSCLPLLEPASGAGEPPAASRDWNRNSARKAAALGLVFGVNFALGPTEVIKPDQRKGAARLNGRSPRGDDKAVAVSEYRRCKNEEALRALAEWRWES